MGAEIVRRILMSQATRRTLYPPPRGRMQGAASPDSPQSITLPIIIERYPGPDTLEPEIMAEPQEVKARIIG